MSELQITIFYIASINPDAAGSALWIKLPGHEALP